MNFFYDQNAYKMEQLSIYNRKNYRAAAEELSNN